MASITCQGNATGNFYLEAFRKNKVSTINFCVFINKNDFTSFYNLQGILKSIDVFYIIVTFGYDFLVSITTAYWPSFVRFCPKGLLVFFQSSIDRVAGIFTNTASV